MKKPVIYLETSLFGFYFDEEPRNILKKEAVISLFLQIQESRFITVTSPITIRELSKAPEPYKLQLLGILSKLKIGELKTDVNEVEQLAASYIEQKIIPEDFFDDARHVAYATIEKVDVFVTLNLEHIANEWTIRKINRLNLIEGYSTITIRTPEEVIIYED